MNNEGGLSNDPADSGGLTNFGLTLKFLEDRRIDVNGDKLIDEKDIYALTLPIAKKIYYMQYWLEFQYYRIKDTSIATKVLDMAVNMGEFTAHRLVQRAINDIIKSPIKADGLLGNQTFNAINSIPERYLHQELRDISKEHYLYLIKMNPKNEKFEHGWLKRAAW